MTTTRFQFLTAVIFGAALLPCPIAAADDAVTFDDNVLPVLRQRCGSCHNPDKKAGGLDITTYTGLMAGGGSGGSIEPGDASASYLYRLVTQEDEPKMPPDSPPIPEEEQAILKRWIDGGILENKGSKASAPKKKKFNLAMSASPTERPATVPLPAHLPLEPAVHTRSLNACTSIATSPWAPLAAVCGQKQVLLYRTDTRELAGVLPFPEGRPQVLQFSRNGSLVLAGGGRGGASGKVVVWSVDSGRRIMEIGDELDTVLAADISSDHRFVALGGPQKVVRIYSTETGERLHEMKKHTDWVTAAGFSPDGVLLATGDRNGGVMVWESGTGRDYLTLSGHTAAITAVSWRGDSNLLATGSEDGTIRLWEMENGGQVKSWNAHGGGVASLEFTRDGRIVSIGRDKQPKLWAQDGNQQKAFDACADLGLAVSFCDETDSVIVGDWTGEIRVWKAADGVRLAGITSNPEPIAARIAAAEKAVGERAPAVEPAKAAAAEVAGQLAGMQQAFDGLMQAKVGADSQLAEMQKGFDAAMAAKTEAAAAYSLATDAAVAAARDLVPLVEAQAKSLAAVAQNPADEAAKQSMAQAGEKLRLQREAIAAREAELMVSATRIADGEKKLSETAAQRDQAKAVADQMAAKVAEMTPGLEALKTSAAAAATKVAELSTQLDAARADLARWQGEQAFVQRYAELTGVVASREEVVRQVETRVGEARGKMASDDQARRGIEAQKAERVKAIEALTAALAAAAGEHAGLLEKIAKRQQEIVAQQGTIDTITKATGMLEQAAVQAKAALDAVAGDAELAAAHKLLVDTLAAKAAQVKGMREGMEALAVERAGWEKQAAETAAMMEKRQAEMPALVAAAAEMDGPLAEAAKVVEAAAAAVTAAEAEAAGKQAEVEAAVRDLLALQGIQAPAPTP
jgi:hypothetical protein